MAFITGSRRPVAERASKFSPVPYPVAAPGSFAQVDLHSAESSLQSVAISVTTDMIASLGSELPIEVYRGEGRGRSRVSTPGNLEDPSGDGYGAEDWSYQVLMSWLLRGNLYADILEWQPGGRPAHLLPHHPDEVHGWLEGGRPKWSVNGRLVTDSRTFLHNRVRPVAGRVLGLSPIQFAATTIGVSISAGRYGEQWFRDGAHPSSMLTNEEVEMTKDVSDAAKQRFLAAVYGTREPLVLGKGWKYASIQVTAEESQFLATQKFTEAQCARLYGPGFAEILGYEVGTSMTYSTVESRARDLLVYSINKWLRRLERLLSQLVPRGTFVTLDRDALLQSTTLERYKAHALALQNKWKTVNEVREIEHQKPVAWGDEPNETKPKAITGGGDDKDEDGPQ